MGTDFDLVADEKVFAKIEQRIFRKHKTFEIKDPKGSLVATATTARFGRTFVDLVDCHGSLVGKLRFETSESVSNMLGMYSVLSAQGATLATPERVQTLPAIIDLNDSEGKVAVRLSGLVDHLPLRAWSVERYSGQINPLLLILVPTFVSSKSFL